MKIWIACILFLISVNLKAETDVIEFPEEELATESVLPKFDYHESVKQKYISFSQRFEVGGFVGLALNEPFFNQTKLGLNGTYYTSEKSGWNLMYSMYSSGTTSNAKALKEASNLDVSKAPAPKSLLLANYEMNAFYGKMSLSKKTVAHTSLYGLVGAGMMAFEGKSNPALSVGLGEKFYFGKNFALRVDLRLVVNQAPSPTSSTQIKTSNPGTEEFKQKVTYNSLLDVGFVYLF